MHDTGIEHKKSLTYSRTVMPAPHSKTTRQYSVPTWFNTACGPLRFFSWPRQVCESLAVSAGSQEKAAIGAMFEREMKQEKNLEVTQQTSF